MKPAKRERRKPKRGDSLAVRCSNCGCTSFDIVYPTERFAVERVKCVRCGSLWPFAVERKP